MSREKRINKKLTKLKGQFWGTIGGTKTTPAKAAAARANGKKGGRPKRDSGVCN